MASVPPAPFFCPNPVSPPPWLASSKRQLPSSTLRSSGSGGKRSSLSRRACLFACCLVSPYLSLPNRLQSSEESSVQVW